MMKAPFVLLRTELVENDLTLLREWMTDPEVCRYLNEEKNISPQLNALAGLYLPVLTPLFNQNGRFFMVCAPEETIGFIRLATRSGAEHELVIVIGDRRRWGHGYGKSAIAAALAKAFLEDRREAVIANVFEHNIRSRRALLHNGFSEIQVRDGLVRYRITLKEYLERYKKSALRDAI